MNVQYSVTLTMNWKDVELTERPGEILNPLYCTQLPPLRCSDSGPNLIPESFVVLLRCQEKGKCETEKFLPDVKY